MHTKRARVNGWEQIETKTALSLGLADLNDENHQKHTMNTSIISKVAQDLMVDEINISL